MNAIEWYAAAGWTPRVKVLLEAGERARED